MAKLTDKNITVTAEIICDSLVLSDIGADGMAVLWPKDEWEDLRNYIDVILAAEYKQQIEAVANERRMKEAMSRPLGGLISSIAARARGGP